METEMIQENKTIDNLAEEMGSSLFADIVEFDMEMSEDQYDYKILMGRRFFMLHTGIEPVIRYNYGDDLNTAGSFVTNLSIALKDLSNKTILIVDDTLLHGRAVKRLVTDLIACGCKRENISVKIYLRNKDSKIIDQSLLALSEYRRLQDTNMWRHVSGKIVDTFMASGWPYMYYLPYYETSLHSDRADRVNAFLDERQLQDNAVLHQKSRGISSYLYYSKNSFRMCREVLIRIYKYGQTGKLIIVPYAYLKPLTYSQITEAFKIFADKGMIRYQGNGDFLQDPHALETSNLKMQYAYSLLTYICSLIQGDLFMQGLGLEEWKRKETIERKSLGCDISFPKNCMGDVIEKLEEIQVIEDADFPLEKNDDIDCIISLLMEGRNDFAVQSKMDADYFLNHYLKLSSKRDEELAEKEQERMRGIEVERILHYVPERKDVWRKLEEVIDTGRGTIAVSSNIIEGTTYVDSLLYAGEQNHACNEENLAKLIYPVLQFDMYCQEEKIPPETKENIRTEMIAEIMGESESLRERVSLHEMKEIETEGFAEKYGAYYFARYPMYRGDAEIQHGMEIEQRYEKKYENVYE